MSKKDKQIILVSGGSGFIGSRLARKLEKQYPEDYIVVIDNFSSGSIQNLRGFNGDVIYCTLGTNEAAKILRQRFMIEGGIRFVFHNAAITDTTVDDPKLVLESNVESTRQLLDLCIATKAKLIFASSSAVYGQHPEGKECRVGVNEYPLNMYAFSKLIADNVLREAMKESVVKNRTRIISLRYFNVFGPGEQHKEAAASYIYKIYKQLTNSKEAKVSLFRDTENCERDWVHVNDIVKANLIAAKSVEEGVFGVYNVGTGESTSFAQLINWVGQALDMSGTRVKINTIENPRSDYYQRYTKAYNSLPKFKPKSTKEAIKSYVRWLKKRHGQIPT